MRLIFDLILLTSILVIGFTIVTQQGMLLSFIREWSENKKSKWFALINCIWCMPSAWSLFGYLFAILIGLITDFSWHLVFMYPIVVCGSSFLSGFIWTLYSKIDIQSQHFTNIEKLSFWDVKERKKHHQQNGNN